MGSHRVGHNGSKLAAAATVFSGIPVRKQSSSSNVFILPLSFPISFSQMLVFF